jgi:hypothetical protein
MFACVAHQEGRTVGRHGGNDDRAMLAGGYGGYRVQMHKKGRGCASRALNESNSWKAFDTRNQLGRSQASAVKPQLPFLGARNPLHCLDNCRNGAHRGRRWKPSNIGDDRTRCVAFPGIEKACHGEIVDVRVIGKAPHTIRLRIVSADEDTIRPTGRDERRTAKEGLHARRGADECLDLPDDAERNPRHRGGDVECRECEMHRFNTARPRLSSRFEHRDVMLLAAVLRPSQETAEAHRTDPVRVDSTEDGAHSSGEQPTSFVGGRVRWPLRLNR